MAKVVHVFGDDISTDIIYPGRYMATVLPTETPQFAFADNKELNEILNKKDKSDEVVIVGGKNFGCGSSREQAASTIKGHNITLIAKDFARIFMQNSINLGLRIIICPLIHAEPGDEIIVENGQVFNKSKNRYYEIRPLPKARQAIIDAGGLIPYTRELIKKN